MARRCLSGPPGGTTRNSPSTLAASLIASLERLGPPRPILRVNALPELFERGDPLLRIEAVQAGVLIGGVDYLSGHAVQGGGAGMRQPLRLGQGRPRFVRNSAVRSATFVSSSSRAWRSSSSALVALVDEGGALKCRRSVIRGQAEQELVGLRGKAHATTGRGNDTALGIDTDGNGNTAAWLDRRRRRE